MKVFYSCMWLIVPFLFRKSELCMIPFCCLFCPRHKLKLFFFFLWLWTPNLPTLHCPQSVDFVARQLPFTASIWSTIETHNLLTDAATSIFVLKWTKWLGHPPKDWRNSQINNIVKHHALAVDLLFHFYTLCTLLMGTRSVTLLLFTIPLYALRNKCCDW